MRGRFGGTSTRNVQRWPSVAIAQYLSALAATKSATPAAGMAASEALGFADGKRSILDIRDAVSAEFGIVQELSRFVEYFKAQEKAGRVELVTKQ